MLRFDHSELGNIFKKKVIWVVAGGCWWTNKLAYNFYYFIIGHCCFVVF